MERKPLGDNPYKIAISRYELRLALKHREATGESIQGWVRRLIRETWDYRDPLPEDLEQLSGVETSEPEPPKVIQVDLLEQRELFTPEEWAAMETYEMTDVARRAWCLATRRDLRSQRRNGR